MSMRLMKKMAAVLLVMIVFASFYGACCAEDTLNIVCTSFPCYDFARAVAGEKAQIQMLIKPGSEVHSFEPTPADVMAIAGCDLFIYIGGESDAWVVDILDSFGKAAPKTLRFFDCVEGIEAETEDSQAEHNHEYDEHIWTSPVNACEMVRALEAELCEINPEYSDDYSENAMAYLQEIEALHSQITGIVEQAERKEMIFADRFPFLYFAKEYGIEWHAAFPSCSSESEPSAKTIAQLIGKVKADGIPAIYTLELSNGKTALTIAEETGAKILTFHSIQNVTEADFSAGETYITLMQKNIEALQWGLN